MKTTILLSLPAVIKAANVLPQYGYQENSPWPDSGGGEGHLNQRSLIAEIGNGPIYPNWTFPTAPTASKYYPDLSAGIAIDNNGSVIVPGTYGIVKLDQDGNQLWYNDITGGSYVSFSCTPALTSEGDVIVVDHRANVYKLDGVNGTILWNKNYAGELPVFRLNSGPTISANGTIYIGVEYGKAYALSGDDGSVIWSKHSDTSILWGHTIPYLSKSGDHVYFAVRHVLYKLSTVPLPGENPEPAVEWQFDAPQEGFISSIALDSDDNIFVTAQYGFYKLSSATGQQIWKNENGIYAPRIVLTEDDDVIATQDGKLVRLKGSTGAILWAFELPQGTIAYYEHVILSADGYVVLGATYETTTAIIYKVDVQTGSAYVAFRSNNPNEQRVGYKALGSDGALYVIIASKLYKFGVSCKDWAKEDQQSRQEGECGCPSGVLPQISDERKCSAIVAPNPTNPTNTERPTSNVDSKKKKSDVLVYVLGGAGGFVAIVGSLAVTSIIVKRKQKDAIPYQLQLLSDDSVTTSSARHALQVLADIKAEQFNDTETDRTKAARVKMAIKPFNRTAEPTPATISIIHSKSNVESAVLVQEVLRTIITPGSRVLLDNSASTHLLVLLTSDLLEDSSGLDGMRSLVTALQDSNTNIAAMVLRHRKFDYARLHATIQSLEGDLTHSGSQEESDLSPRDQV